MLKGHWLSQTRKIAHHYQSGNGIKNWDEEVSDSWAFPIDAFNLVSNKSYKFGYIEFGIIPATQAISTMSVSFNILMYGDITTGAPIYECMTGNYDSITRHAIIPEQGGTFTIGYLDTNNQWVSTSYSATVTKLANGQYKIETDIPDKLEHFSWQFSTVSGLTSWTLYIKFRK